MEPMEQEAGNEIRNQENENRIETTNMPGMEEEPLEPVPGAMPPIAANAQAAPAGQKKKVLRVVVAVCLALSLLGGILFTAIVVVPLIRYSSAQKAFDMENYRLAAEKFEALGDYKDASKMAVLSGKAYHYSLGKQAFNANEFDTAHNEYILAGDYADAPKMAGDSLLAGHYSDGAAAIAQGSYAEAITCFQEAQNYLDAPQKVMEANDLLGGKLFDEKDYAAAADHFSVSGNDEMRMQCGIQLVSAGFYANAIEILQDYEDASALSYCGYANAMLCAEQEDYENALLYLEASAGILDAEEKGQEYTFSLGEQCLREGYLNKAKELYKTLPEGYALNGRSARERLELLDQNQKFCDLVGSWWTTDCMYRVQADSTTSSYYYYWYQDALKVGIVTVTCPYTDEGFSVVGSATYPTYTNFSQYSSNLKTEMMTLSFRLDGVTSIPYTLKSTDTCTLQFNGNRFTLNYKYVNRTANVGWHYTFTSNSTYGRRTMLGEDTL